MTISYAGIGSSITVPHLTEKVRHAPQPLLALDQLCNEPDGGALGLHNGAIVQKTFYPDVSRKGGRVAETETVPRATLTPYNMQYTVYEYANSIPFTGLLENLADASLEDNFMKALMNDMRKVQNTEAYNEFNDTDWIANFSSSGYEFRTDGTPASFSNTTNENYTLANVRELVKSAERNNIPYYDGESYVLATGIDSADFFAFDDDVQNRLSHSGEGRAALNGEVQRIGKVRLIKDTADIAVAKASVGGTNLDEGFLIGADAVLNEYALAPEIRVDVSDFNRCKAIAYIFIAAWKKIYSQATNSREHVIKVTAKP